MNDGGPAFPFTPNQQMKLEDGTWDQNTDFGESGMTLRQYYACEAMKVYLNDALPRFTDEGNHDADRLIRREIRRKANAMADEMFREDGEKP